MACPREETANTSCLPSCFGFSRNVSGRKKSGDRDCVSGRKRFWLSRPRFRRRKSGTRTVPVDAAIAKKLTCEIEEGVRDLHESPAIVARVTNRGAAEKGRKGMISNGGKPQSEDHVFKSKSASPKSNQSRPGSPPINPVHCKPSRNARLSWRNPAVGNFHSIAGMSVLVVALAVVIVGGRICAIVCTSALLYFIPRLRTDSNSDEISWNRAPEIDSEKYKKKVILEGLLERNHKSPAAILYHGGA